MIVNQVKKINAINDITLQLYNDCQEIICSLSCFKTPCFKAYFNNVAHIPENLGNFLSSFKKSNLIV